MQRLYRIRELEKQVAELTSRLDAMGSDDERVQAMISEIAEHEGMFDLLSLDDLADKYGGTDERDFWPVIRVQVSPETMAKYEAIMDYMGLVPIMEG